jgi:hypothetical protein
MPLRHSKDLTVLQRLDFQGEGFRGQGPAYRLFLRGEQQ